MIQDIFPRKLDNQYASKMPPAADSPVFCFRGRDCLLSVQGEELVLPRWEALQGSIGEATYLFNIDGEGYYMAEFTGKDLPEGFSFQGVRAQRSMHPRYRVMAMMTAYHLYVWYRDNRFCGRCGGRTVHDDRQRMLSCPACGNMIFPKICPAIIVAVTDGDRLLLTKYSGREHKNYALIAGFCEIGETAEETVRREVMEETGVRVRNLRYWATQPWGMDSDLLIGYFADLDGDPRITMDEGELSLAGWYSREAMDIPADNVSLTNDMIRAFIENRYPR